MGANQSGWAEISSVFAQNMTIEERAILAGGSVLNRIQ